MYLRAMLFFALSAAEPLVTVIVSRHGIRTPYPPGGEGNLTQESMSKYTTKIFPPCWPPGVGSSVWGTSETAGLTPHGGRQVWHMGVWMGSSNFSAVSCDELAIYSDTHSQRDNETATNWTRGAFPKCDIQEGDLIGDPDKFLFNDGSNQDLCSYPSEKVIRSLLGDNLEAVKTAWLSQIQLVDSVVHCCPDTSLCEGKLPCNLSSLPMKYVGKAWAATAGALDMTVFWAEFFLLEYLNGNQQFAQGMLGLPQLVDLYRMAVENLEVMDGRLAGGTFESTMAAHILGSLVQARDKKQVEGIGHKPETRVVYMAGHDTNLLLLRLLLGLQWQSDGWARNALPPGGQLIFQLEEAPGGPAVSAFFQVARPEQMRNDAAFTGADPPSRVPVVLPCPGQPFACPLDTFREVVISRLRKECIGIPGLRDFVGGGSGAGSWPSQYWWTFLLTGGGAFLLGLLLAYVSRRKGRREVSLEDSTTELTN